MNLQILVSRLFAVPILTLALFLTVAPTAHAKDLVADACVADSSVSDVGVQTVTFRTPTLSCEELANAQHMVSLIKAVILPAAVALQKSGVASQLEQKILELELSNPAVLGVTVIGAVGISFFYIVLEESEEQCESQNQLQFKQEIFKEIEAKYGIRASANQSIDYQTN